MTSAEELVGLATVGLLATDGEEKAVQAELLGPVAHADGDGDGEAVADAVGGGSALGGEALEFGDGLVDGGGVDVFFRFEVEVEGALGDFGGAGDVFDAGVVEALPAEEFDGSGEDLIAAQVGQHLFAGWSGRHGFKSRAGNGK